MFCMAFLKEYLMIKGLSMFSNVGIAETYLKEIGIDIIIANELDSNRANL